MCFQEDALIIRELAKQYMEIALSERHVKMRRRFRDSNDLKIVRPPVIIEEIPWHEMNFDGVLDCHCQDERLKKVELELRRALYREKYFQCDNYIVPEWYVRKSYTNSGNGFQIEEKLLSVDRKNNIVSHQYEDVLEDESALERYHDPVLTAYPEKDAENVAFMEEVFDGIIPVKLQGYNIFYSPWDAISSLRGVEPVLIDIYERPEYLHKIVQLFTRGQSCVMDQMERLGLCDPGPMDIHCTPGAVTMPTKPDDSHYLCKDVWFRSAAQMFSSVSPAAHNEFDVQYSLPLARRCGYTYYGCCEPLHDRIDIIKQYPNLRKVGVSPWADVARSAESIGTDYVLSRKPNPALVADVLDEDAVRAELVHTAQQAQKYGCPCEFTLKDISTVSYKPRNLMIWSRIAKEVMDEYYGQ